MYTEENKTIIIIIIIITIEAMVWLISDLNVKDKFRSCIVLCIITA